MTDTIDARVSLREITKETFEDIIDLEVAGDQKGFVAPNVYSIAEAHFSDTAWFRAIYAGETPVGFVMMNIDPGKPEYYLWRYMIDKNHQRKGYGFKAMRQVIDFVISHPGARELTLSYMPGEGCPAPFYARLGFVETGEWDGDEKVMKLAW